MISVEYLITIAIWCGVYAIMSIGLNLILGNIGQPWLGHAALMGVGAYASSMLTAWHGYPFPIGFLAAILIASLIGTLISLPCLRLREDYLAITSIGFNFIVLGVLLYTPYFGGVGGIINIPRPNFLGYVVASWSYLALVLATVVVSAIISWWLSRSWSGIAWRAIREDEIAASVSGIGIRKHKMLAFCVGSGLAGAAGSLYAHYAMSIYPWHFEFSESIGIVAMVVLGGSATTLGPIVGATLLIVFPEAFRFIYDYRLVLYGAMIILVLRYQPAGLLGDEAYMRRLLRKLIPSRKGGLRGGVSCLC